jgi:hypothetical protein
MNTWILIGSGLDFQNQYSPGFGMNIDENFGFVWTFGYA